ncbi:MAG: energy transducer TonB [Gammaproteobacteria bacterium]|nr:energy transducer TonB [Gammaproteobacteria bacterium]
MLRMLLAMPLGAVVAFLLFVFMAGLISGGVAMVSKDEKPVTIEFGRVAPETQVQQRVRQVPKKPEPVKPPPPTAKVVVQQEKPAIDQPNLGLAKLDVGLAGEGPYLGVTGIAANDAALGTPGGEAMAVPLVKIEPSFPREALLSGTEGWVKIQFTIASDGSVKDARVLDAKPKRLFDREAIRAVNKWKFKAQVSNGKAVDTPNQFVIVDFKLAKDS